ncbi:hypothetical protein FIBSPDRAFT_902040 [Athelia psychrophila]|uniref:Uncharacterized protein n=1 Tax=Athelia psychrophila TaxID=1759441 RepID=A0A167XQF7_9AGAM|nr:hypothetical protein FIBSPDRAFT_902040 [Fibularhizoctonia sp. CBS 109695]
MPCVSIVLAGLLTGAALAVVHIQFSSYQKLDSHAKGFDSLLERTTYLDAPFDILPANLSASLVTWQIPRGLNNAAGIVLLVHATGSTGNNSWGVAPCNLLLLAKGYVPNFYRHSATARTLVSGFVALPGDFHGTDEIPLPCTAQDLLRGGCQVTFIQQATGTNLLNIQNVRGNQALVPMTSIYTRDDGAIRPEIGNATSIVLGANNYTLQDLNICGPLYVADHFDPAVDRWPLSAGPGPTPTGNFNAAYCSCSISWCCLKFCWLYSTRPLYGGDPGEARETGHKRSGGREDAFVVCTLSVYRAAV